MGNKMKEILNEYNEHLKNKSDLDKLLDEIGMLEKDPAVVAYNAKNKLLHIFIRNRDNKQQNCNHILLESNTFDWKSNQTCKCLICGWTGHPKNTSKRALLKVANGEYGINNWVEFLELYKIAQELLFSQEEVDFDIAKFQEKLFEMFKNNIIKDGIKTHHHGFNVMIPNYHTDYQVLKLKR